MFRYIFIKKKLISKSINEIRIFLDDTYKSPEKFIKIKEPKTNNFINKKTISGDVKFSIKKNTYSQKDIDKYLEKENDLIIKNILNSTDIVYENISLDIVVNKSFVEMLIILINEKGLKDPQVYKAAQIDKRLFSKIISNKDYKPSKDTALALLFGLKLSLEEAKDMLARAGYILSHSVKRDIIIEYFFKEKIYSLTYINYILEHFNFKIIGRG